MSLRNSGTPHFPLPLSSFTTICCTEYIYTGILYVHSTSTSTVDYITSIHTTVCIYCTVPVLSVQCTGTWCIQYYLIYEIQYYDCNHILQYTHVVQMFIDAVGVTVYWLIE